MFSFGGMSTVLVLTKLQLNFLKAITTLLVQDKAGNI